MEIARRRLLTSLGAGGSIVLAGCVGGCGPGEDEFADLEERISDGELEGGKDYVEVSFEGTIEEVSKERILVDDTTATAIVLPGAAYEWNEAEISEGDCTGDRDGEVHIEDNVDSDTLVIRDTE